MLLRIDSVYTEMVYLFHKDGEAPRREGKKMTQIEISEVTNSYNGKDGCACGCAGTYATKGPALTKRVKLINENMDAVQIYADSEETVFEYTSPTGRVTRLYVAVGA
jgi:hypothetical protein